MRIEYSVEGGLAAFPGLARPRAFDTGDLPPDAARALTDAVAAAGFFTLPAQVGQLPPGSADIPTETLTIVDGARSHTTRIVGPVASPALQDLLRQVKAHLRPAP